MKQATKAVVAVALTWLTAGGAEAESAKPMLSGTVQSYSNGILRLRRADGGTWTAKLDPGGKCNTQLVKGKQVSIRLNGPISDKPLHIDMVVDWAGSEQFVPRTAGAPSYTHEGEWVGPGGVSGRAPNTPNPTGKNNNPGAYAINGGRPDQNLPGTPDLLQPGKQDTRNNKGLSKGVPGFQSGPVPAAPTPVQEPDVSSKGVSNTYYPDMGGPQPGTDPNAPPAGPAGGPPANPAMAAAQPNGAYPNPADPNAAANPWATPAQPGMPGAQPGMPGAQSGYPNMPGMNPSTMTNLNSLLNNGEDGENAESNNNNSMFPGVPTASMGTPVTMQGTVVRFDPGMHSMVVRALGTMTDTNVILGPQVMLQQLREGQTVNISGTSSPQGYIEAQQVTPVGR